MASTLKDKIAEDLKQSMRQGDKAKNSCLRLLLSAIHNTEIARQTELGDADIIGVISKQAKQCQESIDAFKLGNRLDLVDKETAEQAILTAYLPQQISRQEIEAAASAAIKEAGAQGPGDMGKVMSKLMPQLKGKADGKLINTSVSELLRQ